ncbi:hypothetical protein [Candidatus Harpocratesius sp.]
MAKQSLPSHTSSHLDLNKKRTRLRDQSTSSSTSNMVSVRMDQDTRNQLDDIGQQFHLKRSDIARSYLKLCKTVIVKTNQDLQLFDGTKVSFFPQTLLKFMYSRLNPEDLIILGDQLALLAYTNCQIESIHETEKKIGYLEQLGWITINRIREMDAEGKSWIYYAITAQNSPLDLIHALLYRFLFRKKLPPELTAGNIKENLTKITKRFKNSDLEKSLPRFKKELGIHKENFDDFAPLYKFDALREEVND